MNKQSSFNRKLIYLGLIIVLLFPLYGLSRPATLVDKEGGKLSKMRVDNRLSQANLGEIDPASETMKLLTLGLRGVAVNLLWGQADEYKKKEDWTNLTATLEQLARLQPNFITFWKYQSWNVSYNVSVQFDDYRDRYYYVREGIEFLKQGVEKNKENPQIPQLLWDLGWFVGQKIGRADEHVQYRRLFKADDEFHGDDVPPGSDERDNWLVSKKEYLDTVASIRDRGKSIGKKSEKIVYSSPAKSQMSYAEAIEEEGQFEKGQAAWAIAADDWRDFGDQPIEHSTGRILFLGHEHDLAKEVEGLEKQLDNLAPSLRDRMVDEKRAKLSDAERAALDKPLEERTTEEYQLAGVAAQAIAVTDAEFVDRLAKEKPASRKQASMLADRLSDQRTNLIYTQRYKTDANYNYWALRAEFEQTDTAVDARRKMFQAKQAYDDNQDDVTAKRLYEEGFQLWRQLVDNFREQGHDLLDPDGVTGDDLLVFIEDYYRVLKANNEEIPDDFPLWEVIENFDAEMKFEEELREHQRRLQSTDDNAESPADEAEPSTPAEQVEQAESNEAESADEGDAADGEEPADKASDDNQEASNGVSTAESPGEGDEKTAIVAEEATGDSDAG